MRAITNHKKGTVDLKAQEISICGLDTLEKAERNIMIIMNDHIAHPTSQMHTHKKENSLLAHAR